MVEGNMAEPVPKKLPRALGLNWRPVVDEYRQKTDRTDAAEPEAEPEAPRDVAADPLPLPDQEDEKEDAMASPISLHKFQEQLDRNCLDEIALLLLALTYGEMIELADAIWSAPEGTAITKENLPALLHRWSKSRSAGRPHDNTGDGG
jgi:hypothetical protein